MGNRVSTKNEGNQTQITSSYNSLNQLTSSASYDIAGGGQALTGTVGYSYDGDGNQSVVTTNSGDSQSQTQYAYDDQSRLVSVTSVGSSKWEFVYDGLSRLRISRNYTWNAGNGTWTRGGERWRIYDGMDVVQDRDQLNRWRSSIVRAGNIGGILARNTHIRSTLFYAYDMQGNVTTLTDGARQVVASYAYDAFGNTVASSGADAAENPYRFATKEQIGGLYYFGYRFYSPGTGRWINRDPIRESGGVNLYAAMGNDPINSVDDYGLWPRWMTKAGIMEALYGKPKKPCEDDFKAAEQMAANTQRGIKVAATLTEGAYNGIYNEAPKALIMGSLGKGVRIIASASRGAGGFNGTLVFGHGARHLRGSGLSQKVVENAIAQQIRAATQSASITGNFWGKVAVGGANIQYRAFLLPNGTINVGTYYLLP